MIEERPLRQTVETAGVGEAFASPTSGDSLRELTRELARLVGRERTRAFIERTVEAGGVDLPPGDAWLLVQGAEGAPARRPGGDRRRRPFDAAWARRSSRRLAARGLAAARDHGRRPRHGHPPHRRAPRRLHSLIADWQPDDDQRVNDAIARLARELAGELPARRRESIRWMTPTTMRAVVLRAAGGPDELVLEQVATPAPRDGEALVRVHAAALTRGELEWPVDQLPAIASYELSGVVVLGPGVDDVAVGDEVYGMSASTATGSPPSTRDPGELLAPKPHALGHLEAAAVPLAALSAWQGLFDQEGSSGRAGPHPRGRAASASSPRAGARHGAHVTATTSASAWSAPASSAPTS